MSEQQQQQQQQQAAQAVNQWVPVVRWLGTVENAVSSALVTGAVDTDQVQEAADAVRAARLAISALVGEYVTAATPIEGQPQEVQPQPARQWSQRGPIAAARPGDYLQQQPGPQSAQPEHYVRWQS
jgi:hypothetical protein